MRRNSSLSVLVSLFVMLACGLMCGCSDDGETLAERVESGQAVQAERGTMTLDINRTEPAGKRPKGIAKDTWTVFVYLCGSDLETDGGAATADLAEMV